MATTKKRSIKTIIGKLHLWLGLASGIVVFIVGLTGCLYAFESEIRNLYESEFTTVSPTKDPILPASTLKTIGWNAIERQEGKFSATYVYLKLQKDLSQAAELMVYDRKTAFYTSAFLHPQTGKVLKVKNHYTDVFLWIKRMHTSLLLPGEWGHWIIGIAVICFVILLFSGLYLWIPKSKNGWKQRFNIAWGASSKRRNYDMHNVLGFYHILFGLTLAITGLVWSFSWMGATLDWVANGGTSSPPHQEPTVKAFPLSDRNSMQNTLVLNAWSNVKIGAIGTLFPTSPTEPIAVDWFPDHNIYYNIHEWRFDPVSGKRLLIESPETRTNGTQLLHANYDIHIGKIGGFFGQLLAFIGSLTVTSLPITGLRIYLGRHKKSRSK